MFDVQVGVPGKLWTVTATNVVAGSITGTSAAAASGSYGGVAGRKLAITHFSGASSISGTYTIESPAGTVLWQKPMTGTNYEFSENFDPPLVVTAVNQAVVVKGGGYAATNTGTVNAAGFEIESAA